MISTFLSNPCQWASNYLFGSASFSLLYPEDAKSQLETASQGSYKKISLIGCGGLTDQDIIQFIQKSPQLEELNLSETKITDDVLIALQQYCPKLRVFIHNQAGVINEGDVYQISGLIRQLIKTGEPLIPTSKPLTPRPPGWKKGVALIGQEERLLTQRGIAAIAKMQLEQLMIYFHPRVDFEELKPLVGKVKRISLARRSEDHWDERMLDWWKKGTLIDTGSNYK